MLNLKDTIKKLKLIIFDVDGVFTDGSVYIDEQGKEMLKFSRIDGRGIRLLKETGLKTAIITSEDSNIVKIRMKKLKIDQIFTGIQDKMKIYNDLKENYDLNDENICYLGDDTNDIEIMKIVGFACCPINAQKRVKKISKFVSDLKGGEGFVREICNLIVKNLEEQPKKANNVLE